MKTTIINLLKKHLASFLAGLLSALAVALGSGCKMQMSEFTCEISAPSSQSSTL